MAILTRTHVHYSSAHYTLSHKLARTMIGAIYAISQDTGYHRRGLFHTAKCAVLYQE